MATSPLAQTPPAALDVTGISAITTNSSPSDPRLGTLYDPKNWAAAVPVWFHGLPDGRFLKLASRRWTNATLSPGDPGGYTTYTEELAPSWTMFSAPTGARSAPPGGYTIPMSTPHSGSPVLTAAVSRANVFYTLNTVGGTTAVVQSFRVTNPGGLIVPMSEETVPSPVVAPVGMAAADWDQLTPAQQAAQGVPLCFGQGVYLWGPHIYVIGTDPSGRMFRARKPWARVGTTAIITSVLGAVTSDPNWEYEGSGNWGRASTPSPMTGSTGVLTTVGPVSAFYRRNQLYLATVAQTSTGYTGTVMSSRGAHDPWSPVTTVDLGPTGNYLGSGVCFQPQLPPVDHSTVLYVTSQKKIVNTVPRIDVTWGALTLPL